MTNAMLQTFMKKKPMKKLTACPLLDSSSCPVVNLICHKFKIAHKYPYIEELSSQANVSKL